MDRVAIIGVACLFPGAASPREFWENLERRRSTTSSATAAEMAIDPARYYDPTRGRRDHYYSMRGGFVRHFTFDPHGYRLPAELLAELDVVFQWPLYVAREALRDAGYADIDGRAPAGVVLGNLSFPTRRTNLLCTPIYRRAVSTALRSVLDAPQIELAPPAGDTSMPPLENTLVAGYPAAIVAEALGLDGPAFALDAACASSLYSVKMACRYLETGQADLMLAGAVSAADPFFIHMGFSIFQAYPGEGSASRPLDRSSRGLYSGEGAGMLVLKRYADALRDGDRIYATIDGIGLSNDGRGKHLLTPNPRGQRLAFERAYAEAGIDPQLIDYVECHATGTPIGDITELNSMEAFFGARGGQPLIGSVKANFGHLLTAAGMASIIKVALSMEAGRIPGTINISDPLVSQGGMFGGDRIVTETTPWPDRGPIRRAAVSAFGFGGTNAHMIMSRGPREEGIVAPATPPAPPPIAIIGLDAHFGPCATIEQFGAAIAGGQPQFIPLPEQRWKGIEAAEDVLRHAGLAAAPQGAYIDSFDFDFLHFRHPPNPADQPIAQQLLALKVADRALRDSGIREGGNVAVLIAMATELALHQFRGRVDLGWQIRDALERAGIELDAAELAHLETIAQDSVHVPALVNQYTSFIGNIMASRVASLWDFSGPALTISAEDQSVVRALEVAQLLLTTGEVDAVVIGAVDLSGGFEHVLLRHGMQAVRVDDPRPSFDIAGGGWLVGEGAGAVVLRRRADALRDGARIYATIDGLASARGEQRVADAARRALAAARLTPAAVGYIELSADGDPAADAAEIAALRHVYQSGADEPHCAVGTVKTIVGHTFAAAGMASLIKAALCVSGRYIPALPGLTAARDAGLWSGGPFYAPPDARPWLTGQSRARRVAAVGCAGSDGTYAQIILGEEPGVPAGRRTPTAVAPPLLLPLQAHDVAGLNEQFDTLERQLDDGVELTTIARERIAAFAEYGMAPLRMALAGRSGAELRREIAMARGSIPDALATGGEWRTPVGSCFSARQLAREGGISFVYPGGASVALGAGRDLLMLFPELHDEYAAGQIDTGLIYPRTIGVPSPEAIDTHKRRLRADLVAMLRNSAAFALLSTKLLRTTFGIEPTSALGYSMGESTMLLALDAWTDVGELANRLRESTIFHSELAGRRDAARRYFDMPDAPAEFWGVYLVRGPATQVQAALRDEPRVFVTLINTPNEVIVAGASADAERALQALGCEYSRAPFDHVIHAPPARALFADLLAFNTLPTGKVTGINFYSTTRPDPLPVEQAALAKSMAHATVEIFDFAGLVERVYAAGARIFVELGPGAACTRWVDANLGDRPHAAIAIDERGDGHTGLIRALARLIAHGVPVSADGLMHLNGLDGATAPVENRPSLSRSVLTGGARIVDTIAAPEHIAHFRAVRRLREPALAHAAAAHEPATAVALHGGDAPPRTEHRVAHEPIRSTTIPPRNGTHTAPAGDTPPQHAAYLAERREGLRTLAASLRDALAAAGATPPQPQLAVAPPAPLAPPRRAAIWDEDDLVEFAEGAIANVFGPEYAPIDNYGRRVRLPTFPYLLVSRVTKIDGELGTYRPCSITTEYDIPHGAWYTVDGQIPWAISVESGQCDLLLISYLGIDFENKGDRVYRLLDCTLTFLTDLSKEGETLRYDIKINSFARSGQSLLFFFSYECFVGDTMVLKMENGCAGFFTDEELAAGKGVIFTEAEIKERTNAVKRFFPPLLECARAAFTRDDLLALSAGAPARVFGPAYEQRGRNPSLRLPPSQMLMLDRVTSVERQGGAWGLGMVIAEKDLTPDDWYFPCHFKDDQVLAGSLQAEGCGQLLQFYMLLLGLQTRTEDARFQPIFGLPQVVRCRGQVTPQYGKLIYRMEVTDIGLEPHPFVRAHVDIVLGDRVVVHFHDLGLQLIEKQPHERDAAGGAQLAAPRTPPLIDTAAIEEFARGSVAKGLGPEFAVFDTRRGPRIPNSELGLISRVMSIDGTRHNFKSPAAIVSEYDIPADGWFLSENNYPTAPSAVLMEIALQPCGFLSAWMGSPLIFPDADLYFRNLDGKARLLREVDLRGRTVVNHGRLTSSTSIRGIILQHLSFTLSCEGEPFYEGEASFGYFTPETFATQTGLDGGQRVTRWIDEAGRPAPAPIAINTAAARDALARGPHARLARGRLTLLDEVQVVVNGGRHGGGYVAARKRIDAREWFFRAHFHQDPVMPGSLGIEAIVEALEAYALAADLGRTLGGEWRFAPGAGIATTWKYRGQIVPQSGEMRLEAHVRAVESVGAGLQIVADASVWCDGLRIYAVDNIAIDLKRVDRTS
jgi:PfaB family protein